jgi:hypothetical protein
LEKRGDSAGAVAVNILFCLAQFCVGFTKRRKQKNRIVSESIRSPRRLRNCSGTLSVGFQKQYTLSRQRQRAKKTRLAVGSSIFKFFQEFVDAIGIRSTGPGISGRMNTRPSVKCGNLQARIIGEYRELSQAGIGYCFHASVLRKRAPGFFKIRIYGHVLEAQNLASQAREQSSKFSKLASVPSRNHNGLEVKGGHAKIVSPLQGSICH